MREIVIARDVAEKELESMIELFDGTVGSDEDKNNLIGAIMDGRITVNTADETIKYTFAVPVKLKNDDLVTEAVFHEPTSGDLEYINKGQKVVVSTTGGTATMDMSDIYVKTSRMLTRIAKLSLGVSDLIKRRDMAVLNSICNFFG